MGHGGTRKGAGRKSESKVMKKATAGEILSEVDEVELWTQLLNSSNSCFGVAPSHGGFLIWANDSAVQDRRISLQSFLRQGLHA